MEENQREESTGQEEHPEEIRWVLAKEAICSHGITGKEAAARYGLSYDALRQRCHREAWPTMEAVARVVTEKSQNREITAQSAENWLEKGEIHRGMAFKIAHQAVKNAIKAPPEVKDWADLERADKMARRAAGLEQDIATQSNAFTFTLVKELVGVADAVEIGGELLPE